MKAKNPELYARYVDGKEFILIDAPFGYLEPKIRKTGFTEIRRDPDVKSSIFDNNCFKFYLIKYCEIIGIEALVMLIQEEKLDENIKRQSRQLSYDQKVKILKFILENERELGVNDKSWRHCLFFLYACGVLTEEELKSHFTLRVKTGRQEE